jgi:FKBP-type peptidyl-prolyl cis-trans isomerase
MKSSKIVLCILVLAIGFSACQSVDFKKTSTGVPYKIFSSSKGDSAREGTFVEYNVIQKLKDSVLFSSYANKSPFYAEIKSQLEKPAYANIRAVAEDLISQTKEGDSIYIVQSTDSLLKQNPDLTVFKKGQQVVTTIRVVKVFKTKDEANANMMKQQAAMYEENEKNMLEAHKKDTAAQASIQRDSKIIEDYLKAHNIQAQKTEWGFYVESLAPGEGPKPKFGQFVSVKYKGMDLAGKVFDQGVYPVQVGFAQAIPGFAEAVNLLSKGEKVRVYIPSALGYGQSGRPPQIQPNEILVFEMEAADISDKQPAPQTQPQQQQNDTKKQK